MPATNRNFYIDNIRIGLTALVIMHHAAITYGAPGGWYYREENASQLSVVLLTMFVATNQAFFMGFFFFLSSFFMPSSYQRKGGVYFMMDRLKRLGIPLVFYSLVIAPVTIYLTLRFAEGATYSFTEYYTHRDQWIEFGVLWFTAALLLFTILYWIFKRRSPTPATSLTPLPSNRTIIAFAFAIGVVSFLVRLVFPVGWVLQPVGFQLSYFPQYVALFIIGIVSFRNQWLQSITYKSGMRWLSVAAVVLLVGFPLMYVFKVATNSPISDFQGGLNAASFISCIWEQLMGVSLIMALLGIGKAKFNTQGPVRKALSRSAYVVYITHPLVLVAIALLFITVPLSASMKFFIVGPLAVVISFVLGQLMVKIPWIKDVV